MIKEAYLFMGTYVTEDEIFKLFNEKKGNYPRRFSEEHIANIEEEVRWKYKLRDIDNVLREHGKVIDGLALECRHVGYAEDSVYIIGRTYHKMIIQDYVVQKRASILINISDIEKNLSDVQKRLQELGIEKDAQLLSISENR